MFFKTVKDYGLIIGVGKAFDKIKHSPPRK